MPEALNEYRCKDCFAQFSSDDSDTPMCPECGGTETEELLGSADAGRSAPEGASDIMAALPEAPASRTESGGTSPNQIEEESPDAGTKSIAMVGYSNSGKSFLVNRLLHVLDDRIEYEPSNPGRKEIPQTGRGDYIEDYIKNSPSRFDLRRQRGYRVVDVAGEYLVDVVARREGNVRLMGAEERIMAEQFFRAVQCADAFVLVVPTGHLVEEWEHAIPAGARLGTTVREQGGLEGGREVLRGISRLFTVLLAVQHCSTPADLDRLLDVGIGEAELEQAYWSRDKIKVPVAVTFSQTDLVPDSSRARSLGVDHDPWRFAATVNPRLYKAVLRHCTRCRFSFTTAFADHPPGRAEVDYRSSHYGVEDTFGWVFDELQDWAWPFNGLRRLLRGNCAAYSSSTLVRWLRRTTDSEFMQSEKGRSA